MVGRVAFTLRKCNLRHAFYQSMSFVLPFFLYRGKKEAKKGTLSDVLGVSSSAELDLGRCPKTEELRILGQHFEKVGSKLLDLRQPRFYYKCAAVSGASSCSRTF